MQANQDEALGGSTQGSEAIAAFAEYASAAPELTTVERSTLTINCGCQMRPALSPGNVQRLSYKLDEGIDLDPISVVQDDEGNRYVVDGYHRIAAYDSRKQFTIPALITKGSLAYAQHLAAAANAKTSMERDPATVRRAIKHCLQAEATQGWSDSAIARHVGTSRSTVLRARQALEQEGQFSRETVTVNRGGQAFTMAKPKREPSKPQQPEGVDPDDCQLYAAVPDFKIMSREQNANWLNWLTDLYSAFCAVERCPFNNEPNAIVIRWVEDGEPKDLEALSGGRRVAVLLSLILESDDPTPLFVDQPEDELDNRFLNETIIPALHRLKGKRQVVFATHNANLVVNGDADQVIALEADAEHGRVYAAGAIEDEAIRSAIVRTLDGGAEAFRLRRKKYGY